MRGLRRACRRASPTRARWTSSQRRAGSTRSRSGSATPSRPATPSSPARCSRAWLRRSAASRETAALPLPPAADDHEWLGRPGGAGRTADASHVKRGVGYARRDQEPHVLRGLRRLLDGALPARRRRRLAQARNRRSRPGLRHDRGSRSPATSSASTRSCSNRPTPRSGQRARRRRHDRRGCRAGRPTWRAGLCVSGCSSTSRRRSASTLSRLVIEGTEVVDTVGGSRVSVADATARRRA